MLESPSSQAEYSEYTTQAVRDRPDVMEEIMHCPKGIHAFGHSHLQWHMENCGIFHINPGSCGCSLSASTDATYTIVELTADSWLVSEHHVKYDVEVTIDGLRSSALYEHAEIWCRVIIYQLREGRDYISFVLRYALETAKKYGYKEASPVSNEIWHEAARTFKMIDIYR